MSAVQKIEEVIVHLPESELRRFRAWFTDFDAKAWDRQFEADAASGKLDRLADQALEDSSRGRCTGL